MDKERPTPNIDAAPVVISNNKQTKISPLRTQNKNLIAISGAGPTTCLTWFEPQCERCGASTWLWRQQEGHFAGLGKKMGSCLKKKPLDPRWEFFWSFCSLPEASYSGDHLLLLSYSNSLEPSRPINLLAGKQLSTGLFFWVFRIPTTCQRFTKPNQARNHNKPNTKQNQTKPNTK